METFEKVLDIFLPILYIVFFLLLFLIILFLIRETVTWYWKQTEIVKLLSEIRDLLKLKK